MEANEEIEIDGSYGEGGGQILRTSLALSAILNKPLKIHHIRAKRKNSGLRPQHLKGVEALAQITEAKIRGAQIGSEVVAFSPGNVSSGDYQFEVGNGRRSAGSVSLLLQTILPLLCLSAGKSRLTLKGGTHVPWSPPFHYLSEILFPTLACMGIAVQGTIERWGWFPKGGGIIRVEIKPGPELKPMILVDRGPLKRIRGLSAVSQLPRHVAERQRDYAVERVDRDMKLKADIEILYEAPGQGPGSFLFLIVESEKAVAGFSSLGERGKRAEEVAREAVDSLEDYVQSDTAIDSHLADQLVLFMALAKGRSSLTTHRITNHLITNLWTIQQFMNLRISLSGDLGKRGRVDISSG